MGDNSRFQEKAVFPLIFEPSTYLLDIIFCAISVWFSLIEENGPILFLLRMHLFMSQQLSMLVFRMEVWQVPGHHNFDYY